MKPTAVNLHLCMVITPSYFQTAFIVLTFFSGLQSTLFLLSLFTMSIPQAVSIPLEIEFIDLTQEDDSFAHDVVVVSDSDSDTEADPDSDTEADDDATVVAYCPAPVPRKSWAEQMTEDFKDYVENPIPGLVDFRFVDEVPYTPDTKFPVLEYMTHPVTGLEVIRYWTSRTESRVYWGDWKPIRRSKRLQRKSAYRRSVSGRRRARRQQQEARRLGIATVDSGKMKFTGCRVSHPDLN